MTLCAAEIAERAKNWPTEYIEQTGSRVITPTHNNCFVFHRKDKGDYLVITYMEDTEMINVLKNFACEHDAREALRAVAAANGDSASSKGEEE